MSAILEIDRLVMRFGGLVAVDQLSFVVEEGAIHGPIGPNGAGKTTTFNAISGFYKPTAGAVRLRGRTISGLTMHQVARQGLVRTFQHSTLFAEMSLLENAVIGTHRAFRPSLLAAMLGADRRQRAEAERRAMEALAFFDLDDLAEQRAGDLAHGHQRALGMAIAYAAQPDVMLLDEPFTGMNAEETGRMMAVTEKLRADGMTIVIVEHDMKAIMGLCDRITCMSFGKLLAEGGPDDIRSDPAVIQAYLGGASNAA
jgi:branched-chain amino acid transport system ATP-binding protein